MIKISWQSIKLDGALFERLLLAAVALLVLFACTAAARYLIRLRAPWYAYLLPVLLAGGFVFAARASAARQAEKPLRADLVFLTGCLLVFAASRVLWISLVPTQLVSDFAIYEEFARDIAAASPLDELFDSAYLLRLYALGYPLVLAVIYLLTGSGQSGSLPVAQAANLLFGMASLALVFILARKMSGSGAARLAALLFTLWPAQLAFSSVLAAEHMATLLALAGLAAVYPALQSDRLPLPGLVAGGVFFALGVAARNTNLLIFLAVLIALVLFSPQQLMRRLAAAGLLVAVYAGSTWLYRELIHARVNVYPTSTTAFSLLVGANYRAGGAWNYEDFDLIRFHENIEAAEEFAWQEGLRRITRRPERFVRLAVHKAAVLWQDDGYSIYWATEKLDLERFPWNVDDFKRRFIYASQSFHLASWLLASAAALILLRRPTGRMNVIAMTLLGSTLMHAVLEVQNRYAYWLMPLVFILVAVGWAEFFERKPGIPMPAASQPAPIEPEG